MATLNIGIAHLTIGAHNANRREAGNQEGTGFLSRLYRFASAAQELADKSPDHNYNRTDWWTTRL